MEKQKKWLDSGTVLLYQIREWKYKTLPKYLVSASVKCTKKHTLRLAKTKSKTNSKPSEIGRRRTPGQAVRVRGQRTEWGSWDRFLCWIKSVLLFSLSPVKTARISQPFPSLILIPVQPPSSLQPLLKWLWSGLPASPLIPAYLVLHYT